MHTLKTGVPAYFDSFSGLVPVQVLSVKAPETTPQFDLGFGMARISIKVRAKVTEAFGVYKKGEILDGDSVCVVPRKSIRRGRFSSVISGYLVEPDPVVQEPAPAR